MNPTMTTPHTESAKIEVEVPGDLPRHPQEARDELIRELTVRRRCFPGWVQQGKLSATEAQDRVDRMEAAVRILTLVAEALKASSVPFGG